MNISNADLLIWGKENGIPFSMPAGLAVWVILDRAELNLLEDKLQAFHNGVRFDVPLKTVFAFDLVSNTPEAERGAYVSAGILPPDPNFSKDHPMAMLIRGSSVVVRAYKEAFELATKLNYGPDPETTKQQERT